MTSGIQLLLVACVTLIAQTVISGPLNQLTSLVKSNYGKDGPKRKNSLKQEREQLYEAYNLLHSLAQVSAALVFRTLGSVLDSTKVVCLH